MQIVQPMPFDADACAEALHRLCRRYPFLRSRMIGRSCAGRPIAALSLGRSNRPVLLAAGVHGVEWMTSLVLCAFLEHLCEGLRQGSFTLRRETLFVPAVNPDGMQLALHGAKGAGNLAQTVETISGGHYDNWSANARGVDINHNFDAGWRVLREMERAAGITGPAAKQYGGPRPESEPETAALTRLCRIRQPCRALVLHSQGEEIYWRYGAKIPCGAAELAQKFADASGYRLVENAGLASHGGFKDWFISQFARPAFTIEIGKGKNPLPLTDFEGVLARVEPLLREAVAL